MIQYCTLLDIAYLSRGLALYQSLRRHSRSFTLWVLCLDDESHETLSRLQLPGLRPVALADFESGDAALLTAKQNRSRIEYYFTCTPSLALFVLRSAPDADAVVYVDADLYFFSDPALIFAELGGRSILIVGHRFPPHLQYKEVYGIYNVGLLVFRRTAQGLACLQRWREQCLEWCYDRLDGDRFADQKYLDQWPALFSETRVAEHKGVGLAPWNLANYLLHVQNGQVQVDDQPLVFFHFHGLRIYTDWLYGPGVGKYGHVLGSVLKRRVYAPYLRELRSIHRWLRANATQVNATDRIRAGPPGPRELLKLALQRQFLIVTDALLL